MILETNNLPLTEAAWREKVIDDDATPRWLREVDLYLRVKSQFMLSGNVRDRYAFATPDGSYDLLGVPQYLVEYLHLLGFQYFLSIDPLERLTLRIPLAVDDRDAYCKEAFTWCAQIAADAGLRNDAIEYPDLAASASPDSKAATARISFPDALTLAYGIVQQKSGSKLDRRCAIFCEYLMGQSDQGHTREGSIRSLIQALVSSYDAVQHSEGFNPIFWICDRENELPPWLVVGNPRVHHVALAKPDARIRERVCRQILARADGFALEDAAHQTRSISEFANQTEGLTINDIIAIGTFAKDRGIAPNEIASAARRYKVGISEDPWQRMGTDKLAQVEEVMRRRVKGQPKALKQTMDILRRSILGLSGSHFSKNSNRPKGVLFLAGPTGVGKTELAKSLAEGIFGDEHAYIRFDMSEFREKQSDQRLLGAPPGYIGHEAGGELTRAVRERPFSVILFDEVEKADPSIFDKFLQILDDGRLTSGKGERVYFSEAVIVFTSNLGVRSQLRNDFPFDELQEEVRAGVSEYFRETMKRPELLNRLGENIIVFDMIRGPAAEEIVDKMLVNLQESVKERLNVSLVLSEEAHRQLIEECSRDLTFGGRGIGNFIEKTLVNPLGYHLLNMNGATTLRVDTIDPQALELDVTPIHA